MTERSDRTASTMPFSSATRAASCGKRRSGFGFGNGASEIVSPDFPAIGATVCHSSSVMNGMNGCARRSTASSTRTSVRRVPRCCASLPSASCTLASSTYQSQYSSHTNR